MEPASSLVLLIHVNKQQLMLHMGMSWNQPPAIELHTPQPASH